MKKYRIWFDQTNQTYFDVEARTEESARLKAQREWNKRFSFPIPSDIKEIDEDGEKEVGRK